MEQNQDKAKEEHSKQEHQDQHSKEDKEVEKVNPKQEDEEE